MCTILRHRKHTRKRMNSRGFSSIVGAIFMMLIVWSLASSYFWFTLSQNTTYNNTVRQMNQLDLSRMSETAQASNITYNINTNNIVNVTGQIQNIGSSSINFTTIWTCATNGTWTGYNFTRLNVVVPCGSTYSLNQLFTINGLVTTSSYHVTSWLITTRGNTVPLPKQPAMTNNVIVAQVSQGIGSIALNFEQFWHYEFSVTPAQGTSLPSASPKNYTISASKYTVYHVVLTDLDPLRQNIVLDGNSSIYIVGQHSNTVKYATWDLVTVTSNKIYPSSDVQYTLQFGVPTELYFSGTISGIDENNLYPLNILLFGKKGNNDYGQNIPFVSIYLVP